MRRSPLTFLPLAVLALACQGTAPSAGARSGISGAEAKKMVADGALLLDVRTPEEFAEGHLPGAQNVPLGAIDSAMLGPSPKLSKGRPIIVDCRSGARSTAAAQHLAAAGFRVRNLGPMASWNR